MLLAAGSGSRLGAGPKALLRLGRGREPQVRHLIRALWRGGCDEVIVVLGAAHGQVSQVLGPGPHRVVINDAWETGMASSFRAGIAVAEQFLAGEDAGSVMVALVDQPDTDEHVVAHLKASAAMGRVTAAGFPDERGKLVRGHPLIFPVALARAAAALAEGDAGGRAWLRAHPGLIDVVDAGHLATGRDVDTPEDLDRWHTEQGGGHGTT